MALSSVIHAGQPRHHVLTDARKGGGLAGQAGQIEKVRVRERGERVEAVGGCHAQSTTQGSRERGGEVADATSGKQTNKQNKQAGWMRRGMWD